MSWLSRVTGLAGPAVVILAVSVGTFVAVVRYTEVLDPATDASWLTSMDRTHTGAPPCLRYPSPPKPASVVEAAEAFADAGISANDVRELVGEVYARAERQESALHPRAQSDEYLDVMARHSGVLGRMVIFLKRDRLNDTLHRTLAFGPPIKLTVAALPEPRRAVFEVQWVRDPAVFVLPGLSDFVERLAVTVTSKRLDRAQALLEQQAAKGEALSLEGLPASERQDDWGGALALDGMTLSSLGKDQMPGGSGADADLVRTIRGAPAPVEPAPPALACEGKTKLTILRTEVEAALEKLSDSAGSARVTPAFTNGVATGFRVTRLRAGSLLVHAGLCDGDVVNTVNGLALTSPDKALEVYSSIKDARRVELSVTREGKPITLVVQIR
ncbi:MAG: hypothetical protein Q8L48_10865 [Archangium sp.]|nr:hypothetical protein [Archangium sp.]